MRHRKRGRILGRSPSHRKALLRNLASALFLTERDAELDDNAPKSKGRIITTLPKAKEVRPLVEKCITIARKSLQHTREAQAFESDAERGSNDWKSWRHSEEWRKWNEAISPAVAARRRALKLLGDKQAVAVLFEEIAPRFEDRPGGYTRILKLATPRLGDAGARAILEFVGVHDRVTVKSEKPAFADERETSAEPRETLVQDQTPRPTDEVQDDAAAADDAGDSAPPQAEGDAGEEKKD